jgi:hypothetical protein
MPTRCNRRLFIADLIACSTCYAHHQELESIIQLVAACGLWYLVFKLSVWCGVEGCVTGLRDAANTLCHTCIYNRLPEDELSSSKHVEDITKLKIKILI